MKKFAIPLIKMSGNDHEPELLEIIENHDGKLLVKFGEYAMTVTKEVFQKELTKSGILNEE